MRILVGMLKGAHIAVTNVIVDIVIVIIIIIIIVIIIIIIITHTFNEGEGRECGRCCGAVETEGFGG
jgi:heme/copper-type cytochrome/quinol oxidase subunit 2